MFTVLWHWLTSTQSVSLGWAGPTTRLRSRTLALLPSRIAFLRKVILPHALSHSLPLSSRDGGKSWAAGLSNRATASSRRPSTHVWQHYVSEVEDWANSPNHHPQPPRQMVPAAWGLSTGPMPVASPFFPEAHKELTKSWHAPYSACVHYSSLSAFTSVDSTEKNGYSILHHTKLNSLSL